MSPADAGLRLDQILTRHVPGLGRRRAAQLFEYGAVLVDGRRAKKGDAARTGDEIAVDPGELDAAAADADAALDVRLETPDLVVVNKPAGQPTAPLSGEERGTLANALLGHYPEMRGVGHSPREPGLLHRLDTQTSGVLLAARNGGAFDRLHHALSGGNLQKTYLAVVSGELPKSQGTITLPLAPHPKDRRRVTPCSIDQAAPAARAATTRWRLVQHAGNCSLLELSVAKAYRHQIRAHLANLGCPIVGDRVYGGEASPALRDRHALHASRVCWPGDGVLPGLDVTVPLPAELQALLDA